MAISKVPSSGITADFDNSLTTADLAPNSVDSSELVDGSIDTSHIGNLQVTAAKVASDVATTAGTQTFTNKTLTAPTLTTPALGTVATGNLSNTAIVYPAGHVIQVVCVSSTTAIDHGGNSYTSSYKIETTITPRYSNSKIWVHINGNWNIYAGNNNANKLAYLGLFE